jgi:hypothetical protein
MPQRQMSPMVKAAVRPRPKRCTTSAGKVAPFSFEAVAMMLAPGLISRTGFMT